MKVPLLDLKSNLSPIRDEIIKSIIEVVDSTRYILGPKVIELEEKIAEYCKTKYAIGVSSGTDALLISLMSLDIKPGDLVITTPYSFFATAGVISRLNAEPVFVDIDPVTFNMDPERLSETLRTGISGSKKIDVSKVKAIVPVHLYGQCADMNKINSLAREYFIPVIEDAAQAIGSEYPSSYGYHKAGGLGDIGCFSFFPSKNLGGMGDGGIVTTNNEELANKIRILRTHGGKPKYYHKIIGGNFRLDPIQASIILVKLKYLNHWHECRQDNADYYNSLFKESHLLEDVIIPERVYTNLYLKNDHIFNQYTIRIENRDSVREFLKSLDVGTEVYYPVPFHLQECFEYLNYKAGDFPESEKASREVLSLPIYPELTNRQQEYVVSCINTFIFEASK